MVDAHGDASAAAGDLVELQGPCTVTADVGGVHGGAEKLATVVDVVGSASSLHKVKASSGAVNPDAPVAPPAVEEQMVRVVGLTDGPGFSVGRMIVGGRKRKLADYDPYEGAFSEDSEYEFKKWHCPYCTTKPKPKDGRFDHLLSHAEDIAIRGEDYKIRGQHVALAKALTPA
ncbi:hypothetical protein D1007_56454 [Hordeum vulgare]|nr:hypothetical protein D1007_56454 [Hordeum vulgare]